MTDVVPFPTLSQQVFHTLWSRIGIKSGGLRVAAATTRIVHARRFLLVSIRACLMSRFRVAARSIRIATCILAVIALFAPPLARGQCPPVAGSGKSQPGQSSASGQPEFFDEPKFTVAGVTDTTNLGGHGSDSVLRTKESLAKETASLSKGSSTKTQPSASVAATEKSLRETAEHNPENFEANHRLGKLLVEDGQAREGLPYLERAAALNPGHYENAYLLARAYADLGKYENARTSVRAVLAQHDQAELHHLLGDVEEKLDHPLEAVREYQRAAELDPSEPNLFDWGAELLMHRAAEPAIEVFAKGNRLFPRSVRMLVGLGVAWYTRGSYEQAARRVCEASDLNPGDPTPYLFLGKMLTVESIQSEGLVERLGRFVKIQPENAMANYYYALSLWKRRKGPEDTENLAQVESLLEKAVHLDPKLGAGYLQLGILYLERGDFPKAISAYQEAIEASPRSAEAHYRLAQAYKRTGESVKAQKELQLYDQISKESAQEVERERREIQQFVYTLRGQTSVSQPR
jgi:tetratricopeptide (TPR) repeat protein